MNEFLTGFLSNDSAFGRFMGKFWIIIAANLAFVVFSLPLVTIGPGLVALYHVMLKTVYGDAQSIRPFKEFWIGFKSNFKQAILVWLVVVGLAVLVYFDARFCDYQGGIMIYFKYAVFAAGLIALIIFLYLLPVMAAFADTIPHLIRNALYFAVRRPLKLIVIVFFDVFPLYLTYTDAQFRPLYVFIWAMCGFGALAMLGSSLLIKDFKPYLDASRKKRAEEAKEAGEPEEDPLAMMAEEDEASVMDDLRKMDGL